MTIAPILASENDTIYAEVNNVMEAEKEQSFDIKIEDIEKILDKDFTQKGSAQSALDKLRQLLRQSKNGN